MGFVANFIRFQQCKIFENRLRFDKVTESFLRHGVHQYARSSALLLLATTTTTTILLTSVLVST